MKTKQAERITEIQKMNNSKLIRRILPKSPSNIMAMTKEQQNECISKESINRTRITVYRNETVADRNKIKN